MLTLHIFQFTSIIKGLLKWQPMKQNKMEGSKRKKKKITDK